MAMRMSFRDPSGFCFVLENRIFRLVHREAAAPFAAFLAGKAGREAIGQGLVVGSRRLPPPEARLWRDRLTAEQPDAPIREDDSLYEHERVPFVSYPSEWPADMLHAAAALTLDVGDRLLESSLGLKDATPYNVLFRGPAPILVDVLSIEARTPGDPIWIPYAQFCRTFLFPLLMWKFWQLDPAGYLLQYRDGIEPEAFYRLCGWGRRLRPPVLQHVSLPVWLGKQAEGNASARPRLLRSADQARFVLGSLYSGLRKALAQASPAARSKTVCINYMGTHSYSENGFASKESLVQSFLETRPKAVLDVGANTGHFSLLAAKAGARVVAIDLDPGCMGRLWQRARAERLDVLPLVVNLARPTPAVGWRNNECASFLERAEGAFDMVLMLAVVHHLLVSERVPLPELAALVSRLTTAWAVIEFVPPEDPMFRRIVRGREHLHAGLTPAAFEEAFSRLFTVQRREPIPDSSRILYLFKKLSCP
jgi:SAM-dependent methyltransferase